MASVYIDPDGAVRSAASGALVAPTGTTARAARMKAALLAAAADALDAAGPRPTPITAAPSYAATRAAVTDAVAVVDVAHLRAETAAQLATLTQEHHRC